ncbi:MAG TPA: LysM peptidoglycan-binding domain-containing protein [Acidimicrobiales bacterium]|nr:LysM peptidoglycan-binding domain-containing protein [Acidimicrobiales bacterium]
MAALSFPSRLTPDRGRRGGVALRLVDDGRNRSPVIGHDWPATAGESPVLALVPDPVPVRQARRRVSSAVRLRRTLLALAGLMVVGLALPLGGAGGPSHPSGSALAGTTHPIEYTVQPGDTLWSIATAVDPSADPRPLVAKLAAQTGSDTVEPGEHISVP